MTYGFIRSYKSDRQKLSVEGNFSRRSYIRESDYATDIFDGQNNKVNSFIQRNPIDGGNTNGAFQIDYEHPIGEKGKLEIGERTYIMDFYSENFPTIQFENQQENKILPQWLKKAAVQKRVNQPNISILIIKCFLTP